MKSGFTQYIYSVGRQLFQQFSKIADKIHGAIAKTPLPRIAVIAMILILFVIMLPLVLALFVLAFLFKLTLVLLMKWMLNSRQFRARDDLIDTPKSPYSKR
jgi:ABC-type bacteriocin/lantibiotic exporter with double-glycine peptidase domain